MKHLIKFLTDNTFANKIILPALPFGGLVAILEFLVQTGTLPGYLFPAPSQIAAVLLQDSFEFVVATQTTIYESLSGLLLSISIGLALALIMASSKLLESALYPYALFFQTVPLISIAPILVIWFGYGIPTVVASSFIVSLFPVVINTLAGLKSTDPALLDLFKLYGSSRWQTLFMLRLPYALPQIVTGVRVAAGLALIGAIVGEFIGGGGLGGLIDAARTQQRLDKVFAAVLISSFAGIAILFIIGLSSRTFFSRWRDLQS